MGMKSKIVFESKIRIPEEVPIFPLPNLILFPGIEIPLYIFEPRYRRMLKDCTNTSKFMAISMFRKGWQDENEPIPSHDIVGVGYVRAMFENSDGTSYILLKGAARAQVTRYLKWEPYRLARVREIPDEVENPEDLKRMATDLRVLLAQKLRFASENPIEPMQMPKEFENPLSLSHLACFFSDASPYLKQKLFENVNCNSRIKELIEILGSEIHPAPNQN